MNELELKEDTRVSFDCNSWTSTGPLKGDYRHRVIIDTEWRVLWRHRDHPL